MDGLNSQYTRIPEIKKKNSPIRIQKTKLSHSVKTPVEYVLFLQRTIGNQAVQELTRSGTLQAKLSIGQPGDVYEQEADRVADEVMRMPDPQEVSRKDPQIQRVYQGCEEEELRRQPIKEEEEEELLQTKEISGQNAETTPDLESRINAIRGGGQLLPESERSFFEPRFGYHFSGVRVHTNAETDKLTKELGAKAFTSGKDIFFQDDTYQPSSKASKELLAHELTHVVQQSGDQGVHALKIHSMETPTIQRGEEPEPLTIAGPTPEEEFEPMHTRHEVVPLELGEPTNDHAALVPAALEMLFRLYTTRDQRFRLMPGDVVFGRDWVVGTTGTAHLRGTIRWKLNRRLDQAGQREHLLRFVDGIQGTEDRQEELRFMINRAFQRAARQGVARAQRTAPTLVDVGREDRGRTFGRRGRARAGGEDLSHRIHAAMDIGGPEGTVEGTGVYSPIDGQVLFAGQGSGYGNLVIIQHNSPPPTTIAGADALTTNYAHLQHCLVSTGEVLAGQAVGLMGATRSGSRVPPGMGVHLHFSVQRVPGGGLPERLRRGRLASAYEERRDLRIHPGRWLDQLGVAIATVDVDAASGPTELVVHGTVQPQPESEPISPSPEPSVPETLRRVVDRKSEARERSLTVAAVSQAPEPGLLQRYIPAGQLPQFGTAEQTAFMRRVYELQRQMSARQRTFVGDLPASQLTEIESGVRARRDAAAACQMLLHAARASLVEQQRAGDLLAMQAHSIGVVSGYRSAQRQFQNWTTNFPRYYRQTQEERAGLLGGEHDAAAARHLARYIRGRLAAPGYSLHNSGIAIDFRTQQGRHNLGASTSQIALWNRSWFFRWLTANAANFGFAQNPSINEPWHWELARGVELIEFSEQEGDVITGSAP